MLECGSCWSGDPVSGSGCLDEGSPPARWSLSSLDRAVEAPLGTGGVLAA